MVACETGTGVSAGAGASGAVPGISRLRVEEINPWMMYGGLIWRLAVYSEFTLLLLESGTCLGR